MADAAFCRNCPKWSNYCLQIALYEATWTRHFTSPKTQTIEKTTMCVDRSDGAHFAYAICRFAYTKVTRLFKNETAYSKAPKSMQTRNELLEAALRALASWTQGYSPTPADVKIIYRFCPGSKHIPFDELCCQIIREATAKLGMPGAEEAKAAQ